MKGNHLNTLTRNSFDDSASKILKAGLLDVPAIRGPPKGMLAAMAVSRAATYCSLHVRISIQKLLPG